jgi:hypothetical protein
VDLPPTNRSICVPLAHAPSSRPTTSHVTRSSHATPCPSCWCRPLFTPVDDLPALCCFAGIKLSSPPHRTYCTATCWLILQQFCQTAPHASYIALLSRAGTGSLLAPSSLLALAAPCHSVVHIVPPLLTS